MVENSAFLDRRMALCVVLPLVIVASTTAWRWNSTTQRLHNEAKSALQANGLVDNLKTLTDRIRLTEDKHKAEQWKRLTKSISRLPVPLQPILGRLRTVVPPSGSAWELEDAAREFVDKHGPLLAELCDLNTNPATLSLVPEDGELNQLLESAADNLMLASGLDMVGCVALRDNDEAGVLRAIENLYACRRSLQGVAPAIGAFVRFDFSQRGLFLLKMGLERGLFGRKSLESLQPLLMRHMQLDSGWRETIEFELAMHMELMSGQSQLASYPPETASPIATRFSSYIFPRASILDRVRFLNLIQKLAEAPTESFEDFQQAQLNCDQLFVELRSPGTRYDFTETGFAYDDNLADAFVADAMRHRLALAAIAIQLFQSEFKRYPQSLSEVPNLIDNEDYQPLGGNPMGYVLQADSSAIVWTASESPWTTPPTPRASDQTVVWTLNAAANE